MTIACPDCGTIQELGPLPPRTVARCIRCDTILEQTAGRSITAAFALSAATLLLLIPGYSLPFLSFHKYGFSAESHLVDGIGVLFGQKQIILALGITVFGVILPLLRFGMLSASLGALRFGFRPPWLAPVFRWATALDLWSMPDVFLLACIVGFNRIAPFVPLRIHAGAYCFLAAALLSMITHAALDHRTVWRAIAPEHAPEGGPGPVVSCLTCDHVLPMSYDGGRCPRCGARVHARKPDSIVRTVALVVTGYLLYLPANIYSMSTMHSIAGREPHTIFWGIMRLVEAGLLPLAVLIFFTSIMLPLLKLMALTWFLLSIHYKSARHLVRRTKIFRLVDDLGRWSNMDPFTVAVFAPLIQFGSLISIHAGVGSTCFFVVVTSSMFASHWFDPRLMWDVAEESGEAGEDHPVRTARHRPDRSAGVANGETSQLESHSHQEGTS